MIFWVGTTISAAVVVSALCSATIIFIPLIGAKFLIMWSLYLSGLFARFVRIPAIHHILSGAAFTTIVFFTVLFLSSLPLVQRMVNSDKRGKYWDFEHNTWAWLVEKKIKTPIKVNTATTNPAISATEAHKPVEVKAVGEVKAQVAPVQAVIPISPKAAATAVQAKVVVPTATTSAVAQVSPIVAAQAKTPVTPNVAVVKTAATVLAEEKAAAKKIEEAQAKAVVAPVIVSKSPVVPPVAKTPVAMSKSPAAVLPVAPKAVKAQAGPTAPAVVVRAPAATTTAPVAAPKVPTAAAVITANAPSAQTTASPTATTTAPVAAPTTTVQKP